MVDSEYRKLRGRIIEKYGTLNAFFETLDISRVQASKKINGNAGFSQDDIWDWCNRLDISTDEIGSFFYAHKV